jgi:urease accessory protein
MHAARLALLHLCDSLFPVGSFAHSDGLEAAVAATQVSCGADLRSWLDAVLDATLTELEGPALRDAMACASARDFTALVQLDDDVDAMRASSEGREASRTLGVRLLKTWQHIRPSDLVADVCAARSRCSFPVAFGVVCAAEGMPVVEALEGLFYTRLAAAVSAAMRLMPLGQHEAHRLLADMLRDVPAGVTRVLASTAPPRGFTPFLDVASMSHQYVHSRLFRS